MICYPSLRMSATCTFCEHGSFRSKVEDILCSTLFTNAAKSQLEDIYLDMQNHVDASRPLKIYPLPFPTLMIKPFYAGHDLPVWLNNPEETNVRIMIISQDPRRSQDEMKGCNELGISSPWGTHSLSWRSQLAKGLLYHVARNLIELFAKKGKTLSVYFTDAYKLRGVASAKMDKLNKSLYQDILKKEIELVNPDIILTVGSAAKDMVYNIGVNKNTIVEAPHPNARPKTWRKNGYPVNIHQDHPYSADKKGDFYIRKIINKAKSLGIY